MANSIRLPQHLDQHPWLYPGYIDNEYSFRGQYRGIVGWYSEDTAELHPPTPEEFGSVIVEGFGGADQVIAKAAEAFKEKKYNLTAKLLSYLISAQPDHQAARQLKADALRAMAQTTRSGIQTRNFLTTHALHLEGKLDWTKPPAISFLPDPTTTSVLATPPGTYLKFLEAQIDPEASKDLESIVKIIFSDLGQSWALHVRRGVAEVTEIVPENVDVTLSLPRLEWAQIVLKETTLLDALSSGKATLEGSEETLLAVFNSLD
jgi:alkyl sulfatase BDS1-like metallo-beta-lactamase superfamily hydrolase